MPLQWWWEVLFIKKFFILLRMITRSHGAVYTLLVDYYTVIYLLVGIRLITILVVIKVTVLL